MRKVAKVDRLLLAVALVLTTLVYLPGLGGPFLFDDGPNLLLNRFIHVDTLGVDALKDAALSNESGLLGRVIPSLSFALNHYFAGGFDPLPFKLTNLAIHLLNGIVLFALMKRLTARLVPAERVDGKILLLIPAVAAGWWLLHPLQLTSVLYVVQRMNSLSALFVLAGLLVFTIGRERLERGAAGGLGLMVAGVVGGGALGALCKENAALIPLYALVIELCCFTRASLPAPSRLLLRGFHLAVVGVPALLALAFAALRPEFILDGYQGRDFTPAQRLLTQPRVLFFYLGLLVFPTRHALGLYHDDFAVSEGLFSPVTTIFALGGWIALIALAVAYRRRLPFLYFAVLWYLAGHAMESTILPLEMVFEHRNYLPVVGPVLALTLAVCVGLKRLTDTGRLAYATLGVVALTLGFVAHSRAYSWSDTYVLLESMVRHHPQAARTHGYYAEVLINARVDPDKAFYHLQQYSRLSPGSINGLWEMLRLVKGAGRAGEVSTAPGHREFTLFDTPLVNDRDSLAGMERLLIDEIERRIQAYPLAASSVKTVENFQRCLYEGAAICVELAPELARWSELALANPKIMTGHRPILLLACAKIQTWLGDVEQGKIYAEMAVRSAPGEVHFLIELARLHLVLGDYARGLAVVERIHAQEPRLGYRAREVAELEAQLRSGIRQRGPGDPSSADSRAEATLRLP